MSHNGHDKSSLAVPPPLHLADDRPVPTCYGFPLKYLSLVTLAVQNAALTLIMHKSRVKTSTHAQYSAASAVLLNELLKGSISFAIAFSHVDVSPHRRASSPSTQSHVALRVRRVAREIFGPDCWKLSVPAVLYVVQNNLQYVAASNLDAATFQVTYQMKILTTAAFSVLLLRRQLSRLKWFALFFLAIGVGLVQIQGGTGASSRQNLADSYAMSPLRGFLAVTAACFTSGLAGVYFEMVLKNTQADLWVRNVQLTLFSLPPAFLSAVLDAPSLTALLRNFGPWAWATVFTQVLGGLLTALVIKYADNILKGFATALSIILAAVASVVLFDLRLSPTFLCGASVVLGATWMYNMSPMAATAAIAASENGTAEMSQTEGKSVRLRPSRPASALGSPVRSSSPILGTFEPEKKRVVTARAIAVALGLPYIREAEDRPLENEPIEHPLYTPPSTRPPSPLPQHPISRPSSRLAVPHHYRPPSRASSSSSLHVVDGQR